MPNPPADVIALAEQFRKALESMDRAALTRVIATYRVLYRNFQARLEQYTAKYGSATKSAQRAALKSLMADVEAELERYSQWLGIEMGTSAGGMIQRGLQDAQEFVLAQNPALVATYHRLPDEVVKQMLGFLDPKGPLYQRLAELAPHNVSLLSETILDAIATGLNPITTARMIAKAKDAFGMTLTDSMRMMRTVQLYAYRETSRASYVANANIVRGWLWYAHLDETVCMSCVAMHGTFHTNEETLDDHHNGRCVMLPIVFGQEDAEVIREKGVDWFAKQPEEVQRRMMGPEYYQAYQGGAFSLSELAKQHEDEVYGHMRSVAPLWELLGAEPPHGSA